MLKINRRSFIAGSATAAASFAILDPRIVKGFDANSRIEVGFVGLGGRGSLIARMIAENHKGCQIVSIADYFPKVAQNAGNRLKVDPTASAFCTPWRGSSYSSEITGTSIVLALAVFALLTILIATLIWLSNPSKAIRKEIHVSYLVSPRTKELPYGLRFTDTSTSVSYDNARWIFKNFRDKNPDNAKKIQELAKVPGQGDFQFAIRFFKEFTEYLVAFYLGNHFTTPEADSTLYRKETAKWLSLASAPSKVLSPLSVCHIIGLVEVHLLSFSTSSHFFPFSSLRSIVHERNSWTRSWG